VHLSDYPIADLAKVDEQLAQDMRLAMKVASLGRAARSLLGIKVRQPLQKVLVAKIGFRGVPKWEREALRRLESQILEELNVKELVFSSRRELITNVKVGSHGALAESERELLLRGEFPEFDKNEVTFSTEKDDQPSDIKIDYKISFKDKPGYAVAQEGGYAVAVTTEITPPLADEGMARELVHRLQTMRKQAGFDIADYILTYYRGGASIQRVIREFATYIKQETLSRDLIEGIPEDAYTESHRIDGEEVVLGVLR